MPNQYFARRQSTIRRMELSKSPMIHLDEDGSLPNDEPFVALQDSTDGIEGYNVLCFLFIVIPILAFLVKALMA